MAMQVGVTVPEELKAHGGRPTENDQPVSSVYQPVSLKELNILDMTNELPALVSVN
jgi:hypothetical protein